MPAYAGNSSALSTKLVCVYPDNYKKGLSTHLCHILLFNPEDGTLKAVSIANLFHVVDYCLFHGNCVVFIGFSFFIGYQ